MRRAGPASIHGIWGQPEERLLGGARGSFRPACGTGLRTSSDTRVALPSSTRSIGLFEDEDEDEDEGRAAALPGATFNRAHPRCLRLILLYFSALLRRPCVSGSLAGSL